MLTLGISESHAKRTTTGRREDEKKRSEKQLGSGKGGSRAEGDGGFYNLG